jgi:hypothetical protein
MADGRPVSGAPSPARTPGSATDRCTGGEEVVEAAGAGEAADAGETRGADTGRADVRGADAGGGDACGAGNTDGAADAVGAGDADDARGAGDGAGGLRTPVGRLGGAAASAGEERKRALEGNAVKGSPSPSCGTRRTGGGGTTPDPA